MLTVTIVISALMLSFIAFPLSVTAQGPDSNPGKSQAVSAFGKIPGKDLIVHIWVVVPHGSDKNEIVREALGQQGARPFDHSEFSTTGLVWDQFKDGSTNPKVLLNYNSANEEPNGLNILQATHPTWTAVPGSNFVFEFDSQTIRCPSLVKECPGDQIFDGYNDIGWVKIKNPHTLAVTWYGTTIDEADVAWSTNNRINWGGNFDVQTVLLHELGHVLGLGHSAETDAVMFASYQGLRHILHTDDVCGIQTLYGTPGPGCTSEPPPDPDPTPGTPTSLDITHGSQHGSDGKIGTYSNRDTVHIFVKALDGIDGVPGIPIHVVVNSEKSTLSGDTTTDDNGVAHIHYKVKAGRDGTGTYHISASGGGLSCDHDDGACHADFTVQK